MDTYGVKYIGSKDKLVASILSVINNLPLKDNTAIDVFTGTTRVAQALKRSGFSVQSSDLSWATEHYANTLVVSNDNSRLENVVNELNTIKPKPGWISDNYCDVIADGNIVRVWQRKNGEKADAIRDKIESMDLCPIDKSILITSLIFALDKVDNTVGVQQAYLKDWCKRSYNDLRLEIPPAVNGKVCHHLVGNCLDLEYNEASVAYLDPPYSAHSYATYYHIWDSIAKWDKPKVKLKTNRREDRVGGTGEFESDWNKKRKAFDATVKLIERLPVEYIVMSYNNESIIPEEMLLDYFGQYDNDVIEIDYKRNIMSSIGNAKKYKSSFDCNNKELILTLRKQ